MKQKMPTLFIGHGSPMNAIEDNEYSRSWSALGEALPRPKAILSISAHWFTRGTKVNDSPTPNMIYDMYGFPDELYQLKYPAPGSPELAHRARSLIGDFVTIDNNWGIDHGTWSVLHRVFPNADIPIVQLSVNATLSLQEHYAIGQSLRPLREEGVLIFGSGNVVHNLSRVNWHMQEGTPWAEEFDQYVNRAVVARAHEKIIDYSSVKEAASLSVPSLDHFAPLLYVLGASDADDTVETLNADCTLGSMSMTSYLFTPKTI